MMTRSEILEFLEPCNLNIYDLAASNYEYRILNYLPYPLNGETHYGATKVVLDLDNENFVIKIPFSSYQESGYSDSSTTTSSRYSYSESYSYGEEFEHANDDFRFAWDYCLQEVLTYRAAKRSKVSKAFAKTSLIGHVHSYPIYIQPRVIPLADYHYSYIGLNREHCSISKSICRSCGCPSIDDYWTTKAYEFYGPSFYNRLMSFIGNYPRLNDLHNENIGFLYDNDQPVLLDYSGYHES